MNKFALTTMVVALLAVVALAGCPTPNTSSTSVGNTGSATGTTSGTATSSTH